MPAAPPHVNRDVDGDLLMPHPQLADNTLDRLLSDRLNRRMERTGTGASVAFPVGRETDAAGDFYQRGNGGISAVF
jgi:hypothetical protein